MVSWTVPSVLVLHQRRMRYYAERESGCRYRQQRFGFWWVGNHCFWQVGVVQPAWLTACVGGEGVDYGGLGARSGRV